MIRALQRFFWLMGCLKKLIEWIQSENWFAGKKTQKMVFFGVICVRAEKNRDFFILSKKPLRA